MRDFLRIFFRRPVVDPSWSLGKIFGGPIVKSLEIILGNLSSTLLEIFFQDQGKFQGFQSWDFYRISTMCSRDCRNIFGGPIVESFVKFFGGPFGRLIVDFMIIIGRESIKICLRTNSGIFKILWRSNH